MASALTMKVVCGAHGQLHLLWIEMIACDIYVDGTVPKLSGLVETAVSMQKYSFRQSSGSLLAASVVSVILWTKVPFG